MILKILIEGRLVAVVVMNSSINSREEGNLELAKLVRKVPVIIFLMFTRERESEEGEGVTEE